jgi:hypothetical protein
LKCVVQGKIGENKGERYKHYKILILNNILCFKAGYKSTGTPV